MSGDNRKKYSIDDYDTLTKQDLYKITSAFEEGRIKIIRFLAEKKAFLVEEKDRDKVPAITYKEIVEYMETTSPDNKYSLQAARKHCKILQDIGAIYQKREPSDDPSARGGELIKFYFVVENVIEMCAILTAVMFGLDKDAAIRIKKAITRIVKQSPSKFVYGIYGSKFFDILEQALGAVRSVAHNYIEAQKDVIKWWSELEEYNRQYYYLWFYPSSFANMVSQAYRSFADYMMSGLTIAQNNIDGYIDMSKTYFRLVEDNVNELSQTALRASKMFQPVPTPAPQGSIPTKGAGIPLPDEQEDVEYDLYALKKLRDELTEIVRIALSGA